MTSKNQENGFTKLGIPVLAVCGYSGSGKTTLLESAIQTLVQRSLSVAVIKHDAHGFTVDRAGKDSDRFFQAGASVALRGREEEFQRRGKGAQLSLEEVIQSFSRDHDLILVEGHKHTPLPKVWMATLSDPLPPESITDVKACLPWDSDRLSIFLAILDKWFCEVWKRRPIYIGLNARHPLSCEEIEGICAFSDLPIYALGGTPNRLQIPSLPIAPDLGGPVSEALTAHRWAPYTTWIVISECGRNSAEMLQYLIGNRRPGIWAVLPKEAEVGSPFLFPWALYEPQGVVLVSRLMQSARTLEEGWNALQNQLKIKYL